MMNDHPPFPGKLNYNSFSNFLQSHFKGRVQKISINAGFTCPNRNGSIAVGGCAYCNNKSFIPSYCHEPGHISEQLRKGIAFFSKRYPACRFLAYFQPYSNTYAEIPHLRNAFHEALSHKQVSGLIISTRPDCIDDEVIDLLRSIAREHFLLVEIGIESTIDRTLDAINRGHDFRCSQTAVGRLHDAGIKTSAHLILGLPGESDADFTNHAYRLSTLPLTAVKIHHLQIVRGSTFAKRYRKNPEHFALFTMKSYIPTIARFLTHLRPDLYIERLCGSTTKEFLIAPRWERRAHEIPLKVNAYMKENKLLQGSLYSSKQLP